MSVAIFLPVRKGSVRLPEKNTKPFGGMKGGLLELKLKQLFCLDVCEIILSTDDARAKEIAKKIDPVGSKIKIFDRPKDLAMDSTRIEDLIKHVPTLSTCTYLLWTHVTSPFATSKIYARALNQFFEKQDSYDSLVSVSSFKKYLWYEKHDQIMNSPSFEKWPQTQSLQDLFILNNAFFMAHRGVYVERADRLGNKPLKIELSEVEAIDIDTEEDFFIAEAVYEKHIKRKEFEKNI